MYIFPQTFAECCGVVRSVWRASSAEGAEGAARVSWWARGLGALLVGRAAAARRPADMAHTRAAVAAVTALDELVNAAPDSARQ